MTKTYQIANISIGGNVIEITSTVEEDGGLTIFDLSYGPTADMTYGEDRDVEVWLKIPPDGARQLSVHLFGTWVEDPADEVAQHLSSQYQGDSHGLSKIQTILDENNVPYEKNMWP